MNTRAVRQFGWRPGGGGFPAGARRVPDHSRGGAGGAAAPRGLGGAGDGTARHDVERMDRDARRLRQRADPSAGQRLPRQAQLPRGRGRAPGRCAVRDRCAAAERGADPGHRAGGPGARRSSPRARAMSSATRPWPQQQAIAQSQLDDEIQAYRAADANVQSLKAAVETAQLNVEFTKVTSLIDGVAAIATAQIGDLVGPATLLTTVSQMSPIKAYFAVSELEYLKMAGSHQRDGWPRAAVGRARRAVADVERRPDVSAQGHVRRRRS